MAQHHTTTDTMGSNQAGARALDRLRKDYEAQGYRVLRELPVKHTDALGAYRPDLVVQKGPELIVIELKNSVETRDTGDLRALRDLIESHPGWHLRVLLVGDTSRRFGSETKVRNLTIVDYRKRIARARTVWQGGDLEAGLTLLWMTIESALRIHFSKDNGVPSQGITALSMLRSLRDDDILDDKEFELLANGYNARNHAVHGFQVRLSKVLVDRLFKVASKLVDRLMKAE